MSMYGVYRIYKNGKLEVEQKNKLTVLGRSNILKSLLGQNQYFANSLGIGISTKSNGTDTFLSMDDLDFTVGKYPIFTSTLGNVGTSDGLVYSARIKDEKRYKIYEVGVFSNVITESANIDSLTVFNFEEGDLLKELPSTFSASVSAASPSVFTSNSHLLSNGDAVTLTGTMPSGLLLNTTYYVVNSQTNTFNLSTSINGTGVSASLGSVTINPSLVYVTDTSFPAQRKSLFLSDTSNDYRIGNNALKITGAGTVFYDEQLLDLSNINPYDNFVFAGWSSASKTVTLTFTDIANVSISYVFNFVSGYNVVSLEQKSNTSYNNLDWEQIAKISISSNSTGYIILDGLKIKPKQVIDNTEGLLSRTVLTDPIEKDSGSIIDIEYVLAVNLDT